MFMFFNFIYNSDNRTIQIKDIVIKLGYDLSGIAISNDKLIIQYISKQNPQPPNNVIAYDHNGEFLWNIKEIMDKDLNYQNILNKNDVFCSIEVFTKDSRPYSELYEFDMNTLKDNRDYLYLYGWSGRTYIIDLQTNEVIYIQGHK